MAKRLYRPKSRRSAEDKRRERLEMFEAAEAAAKKAMIVSHGHCLDGVGSVIVTLRALGPDQVGVAYAQPGEMADVLQIIAGYDGRGRTLHVADLSINPNNWQRVVAAAKAAVERGWRIEWRDHHHKQWEDLPLADLREHVAVLQINDDATESGASLMQKAVGKRDAFSRRLAAAIRDRDLWLNETPDSETLEFAITWMGTEAFTEHFLHPKGRAPVVDDVIREAADKQRAEIEDDTETLLRNAQYYEAGKGKVGVVFGWLPKNVGLHRMIEDGCTMAINVRPNGKMSLRSDPAAPVCHLVARRFNGGGHPNASGGDLALSGLAFQWYLLRRGKVRRVREVAQAAVDEVAKLG